MGLTNLASAGFVVAAAVAVPERPEPAVVAIGSRQPGVRRSADLQLLALRGSATAAVELQDVPVDEEAVIAHDGRRFLCQARPRFLAMQCGLSFGLAQAALQAARETGHAGRGILAPRLDAVHAELLAIAAEMRAGLEDRRFETAPAPLFAQRVRLAALVQQALELELLATGGRAYLADRAPDFGRRWREAAFIPIVTPSLTQLQTALAASSGTRP